MCYVWIGYAIAAASAAQQAKASKDAAAAAKQEAEQRTILAAEAAAAEDRLLGRKDEADRELGEFESDVALRNKELQEEAAVDALALGAARAKETVRRGRQAESTHRQDIRQTIGAQRAQLAGAGVQVGAGSAADIVSDTRRVGDAEARTFRADTELEAKTILANAERTAYEFRTRGLAAGQTSELALLRSAPPEREPTVPSVFSSSVADRSRQIALTGASNIATRFAINRSNRVE